MNKITHCWNRLSKTVKNAIAIAGSILVLLTLLEVVLSLSDRLIGYLDRPPPNTEQEGGGS